MKFYSEKTQKLYDSIEELKAAEKSLDDTEVMALIDELAEKHTKVSDVALEIAKITGKSFAVPEVIAFPNGTLRIASRCGMEREIKLDGTVASTKTKAIKEEDAVQSQKPAPKLENIDPKAINKIFEDKSVKEESALPKKRALTKEEIGILAELFDSLGALGSF